MYIMSEQPMEEDEGTTELGLRSYPYYETFLVPLLPALQTVLHLIHKV